MLLDEGVSPNSEIHMMRADWLAAVLGANEGIVSTASLVGGELPQGAGAAPCWLLVSPDRQKFSARPQQACRSRRCPIGLSSELLRCDSAFHRGVNHAFEIMLAGGGDHHPGALALRKPSGVEGVVQRRGGMVYEMGVGEGDRVADGDSNFAGLNFMPLIWTA